jgi:hypothetical protein
LRAFLKARENTGLPAIHRAHFTAHKSPRIIHHEKIKIPLDELLILLD